MTMMISDFKQATKWNQSEKLDYNLDLVRELKKLAYKAKSGINRSWNF